jgi:hypothetical protein
LNCAEIEVPAALVPSCRTWYFKASETTGTHRPLQPGRFSSR